MFNSISNQYYYLDVPINLKDKEYPCKLIVKDDRKKGKKIDSTNVKFVASVKTTNMGIVDAYIKVSNNNVNINIKSEEMWVKVLEIGKEKIEKTLNNMGFITSVKVDKKEKEANLVKCRDFFEDNEFTRINLKV
jgi:septum formation topological specificity factor MinE